MIAALIFLLIVMGALFFIYRARGSDAGPGTPTEPLSCAEADAMLHQLEADSIAHAHDLARLRQIAEQRARLKAWKKAHCGG